MFTNTGIQSIDNLNLILATVESMNWKGKWKSKEFDLIKLPKREHPTKTAVEQNLKKARVHYGVHLLHNWLSDLSYCDIAGQSHLNTNSQTLPFGKGVVLPKMSTGKYCKRKILLITTCHLDITHLRCKKAVPEEKYDKGVNGHLLGDDVHALVEQHSD